MQSAYVDRQTIMPSQADSEYPTRVVTPMNSYNKVANLGTSSPTNIQAFMTGVLGNNFECERFTCQTPVPI